MSHAYTFSLVSILMYLVPICIEKINTKLAVITGLLLGVLLLIRPTNILLILLFIFYDISSTESFFKRLTWAAHKWKYIIIMGGFCFFSILFSVGLLEMDYGRFVI